MARPKYAFPFPNYERPTPGQNPTPNPVDDARLFIAPAPWWDGREVLAIWHGDGDRPTLVLHEPHKDAAIRPLWDYAAATLPHRKDKDVDAVVVRKEAS